MKLYTEEQLLDICKSVAEKACANGLDEEWIKDKCEDYGYSKIEVTDPLTLEFLMEDNNVDTILVEIIEE